MSVAVHRVVVRGQFSDLTAEQRSALSAEVDQHSIFDSAFTRDGTFTYDERLVAFNFRYELRVVDDGPVGDPAEECLARAAATLEGWAIGFKHLRAAATDMSTMWS